MLPPRFLASPFIGLSLCSVARASNPCPASIPGLRLEQGRNGQLTVQVWVNDSGPHRFLLDTGTSTTILDPVLADFLHLAPVGAARIHGVGFNENATTSRPALIKVGPREFKNLLVNVFALDRLHANTLPIKGVLGTDVLRQFDYLIDYGCLTLCLDSGDVLHSSIHGQPVSLSETGTISVYLPDSSEYFHLVLDSGAEISLLFARNAFLPIDHSVTTRIGGRAWIDNHSASVQVLWREVRTGWLSLPKVPFVNASNLRNSRPFDTAYGLLALNLFRQVFVSPAKRFVVLMP